MGIIAWIKGIVSVRREQRTLILLRGVPGSGKSTLAERLARNGSYPVLSADDFFMVGGEYKWEQNKLGRAHRDCQRRCRAHMESGTIMILVNNTFTKSKDLNPYIKMAAEHGYMVSSVIVENRHGGSNVHAVPEEVVQRMADELMKSIKLQA